MAADRVCLISLKTTLRDRVEESVSEGKTADISIYMAHLDPKLSFDLLQQCADRRMKFVTTQNVREDYLRNADERIEKNKTKKEEETKKIEDYNKEIRELSKTVELRIKQGEKTKRLENQIKAKEKKKEEAVAIVENCKALEGEYEKDKQNIQLHMITFEKLIENCLDKKKEWKDLYTVDQKKEVAKCYVESIKRDSRYYKIVSEYAKRIKELGLHIDDSEASEIIKTAESNLQNDIYF